MSTFENFNEVEEISSWFNWGTSPYDFSRFRQIEARPDACLIVQRIANCLVTCLAIRD